MKARLPSASVVIPTFNRLPSLRHVLSAIGPEVRDWPGEVEIVVVDDGSDDGTWAWLRGWSCGVPATRLRRDNAGPARARNLGVAHACGDVVLFLGDDTEPQPGWLTAHMEEHRMRSARPEIAVLGYTSFPPAGDTPFLRWINEFGAQFGYLLIEDPGEVPFNFFYTSNISLPRRVFRDLDGFREDFPAAAWEDIEFAYRATQRGLRLLYQPRARTVHHHRIRPRSFGRRQRVSGRSAAIFAELHPELADFLRLSCAHEPGPAQLLGQILRLVHVQIGESLPGGLSGGRYERFLDFAYLRGLAQGLLERRKES